MATENSTGTRINIQAVNPSQLEPILDSAYARRASLFLWGPPGVGKSTVIRSWANKNKFKLVDVRLTTLEPSDLRGLPHYDEKAKRTTWYLPEFIPAMDDPVPTIIFLDELPAADQRLQASAYELVLDRRIGGKDIPENCWIVAAGNDVADGAVSYGMGSALADRFQHVSVIAHPEAWVKWGQENSLHPSVLSFIRVKGDYLECGKDFMDKNEMIVPTPRSWERVSDIIKYHEDKLAKDKTPINQAALQTEVMGYVGNRVATEFFFVLKEIQELPDIVELLKAKPDQQLKMVPDSLTALYGLAYSLRPYVAGGEDAAKVIRLLENIAGRPSKNPVQEIRVMGMELLFERMRQLNKVPELLKLPEFLAYQRTKMKAVTQL